MAKNITEMLRMAGIGIIHVSGEVERYNVFHVSMLIRHDADGKMYLYNIMDIKKETSNPFEP